MRNRVQELEQRLLPSFNPTKVTRNSYRQPSPHEDISILASYLDSEVWASCNLPTYSTHIPVQKEYASLLGSLVEVDHVKTRYYLSIHTWMPIVSKLRLNRLTEHARGPLKADVVFLLLCMKLLVTREKRPRSSTLYASARKLSKELELKDIITLRTIQAGVLLSMYEVGHGIYPAAFLTISCCARQGVALGLHNKLAPQRAGNPRSWVDWEERQRIWWMIVILDRL